MVFAVTSLQIKRTIIAVTVSDMHFIRGDEFRHVLTGQCSFCYTPLPPTHPYFVANAETHLFTQYFTRRLFYIPSITTTGKLVRAIIIACYEP